MLKKSDNLTKGLVIADAGPIFSLAVLDKLELLDTLFDKVLIPVAVWEEITADKTTSEYSLIVNYFKEKVREIKSFNNLTFVMDYGESQSLILYMEQNAQFLLIDDKKARTFAENFQILCIGTLGILIKAKKMGLLTALKPLFIKLLHNKRFYAKELLNKILENNNEEKI